MKSVYSTIRLPVITEKASILREESGVYCFRTHPRANKVEIAKAIEEIFEVKVAEVRTSMVKGKVKRFGKSSSKRPDWKKAWITLAPGEKELDLFETQ